MVLPQGFIYWSRGRAVRASSQPKTLGQEFGDFHLFGSGLTAKQNEGIRTEFKYDLAAGSARCAGTVPLGGHGNSLDFHSASFSRDCGKNSIALRADGQAIGGVLNVTPGIQSSALGKDRRSHAKVGIGSMGIFEGGAGLESISSCCVGVRVLAIVKSSNNV